MTIMQFDGTEKLCYNKSRKGAVEMSRYDKNDSIFTMDISPQDGDYTFRRNPVTGAYGIRRVNINRDFKTTVIFGLIILAVLIVALGRASQPPEITRSTKAREKVSSAIAMPDSFLTDEAGLVDDKSKAESAMAAFYAKTGAAPYIITVPNDKQNTNSAYSDEQLEERAKDTYRELFSDEQHFLILMLQTGETKYRYAFYTGANVIGFMDTEARRIVKDCIEHYLFIERSDVRYKDDSFQSGKALADAFDDAGQRLMRVDVNYPMYIAIGAGGLLLIVVIAGLARRRGRRTGKLTIEKEYLPGEYIPASVMRNSDSDNAARGIKYRYGSEGVAGDMPYIPNGRLLTHDTLHPQMHSAEMPSAEMPSLNIPEGVLLNGSLSGGMVPDMQKNTAQMPSVEMPVSDFLSSGGSTLQYRDNKGNYVYQSSTEKTDNSFEKWAAYYNLNNSESAFADESEEFGGATAVYHDYKGISHLIKNKKDGE